MKKRIFALIVALCLLPAWPAALAEKSYSGRTSLRWTTDEQLENIELAVKALDGVEIERGETFSFNDLVGPRTRARGYVRAENGRGAFVTGGGVGQVASTLYLALLQVPSGIEYDSLSTYGARFTGDYVADGSLAVLTDYSGGTDFEFTNYDSDMRIEMWTNADSLYCTVTLDDDWFDDDTRTITARIPWGGDSRVLNNIELAAESVYDTTLEEGDRFSFNRIVGPRTADYGYVTGINGRGARVMGGGVAQVASVIWMAIKDDDDFTVIEKYTYGKKYNQDYVDNASDAIVTDYQGDTDFSFRYTGEGTATIYTYVEGDYLKCDIAIED